MRCSQLKALPRRNHRKGGSGGSPPSPPVSYDSLPVGKGIIAIAVNSTFFQRAGEAQESFVT